MSKQNRSRVLTAIAFFLLSLMELRASQTVSAWTIDALVYFDGEENTIRGHALTRRDWWDQESGSAGYDHWCECYVTWQVEENSVFLNGWRPSGYAGGVPGYGYPEAWIFIPPIPADESGEWRIETTHYATVYFYGNYNVIDIIDYYLGQRSSKTWVPFCANNDIDVAVREYFDYNVGFIPYCSSFTTSVAGPHIFNWDNFTNMGGHYHHAPWALAIHDIFDRLDDVWVIYGFSLNLTSGYRCPEHNRDHLTPAGARNSRHQYGDAADLKPTNLPWNFDEYQFLRSAAELAGADFIEDWGTGQGQTTSHVHADWRNH